MFQIFDNITRVGKIFLKLLSSGCVLFRWWTLDFLCNQSVENCVFVKQHQSTLKGKNLRIRHKELSQDDIVNDYMIEIADFFDHCYEEWIEHVKKNRDRFYPLNLFTIGQMIILQEEIAKHRNGIRVSKHLCSLLSVVKADCSLKDLELAIKNLDEQLSLEQNDSVADDSSGCEENRAIQEFLRAAEEAGVSKRRAFECIHADAFNADDIDQSKKYFPRHTYSNNSM